jgi:hypothetical protein
MVAVDRRTASLVLLVSTISAFWGLWEGQAYWSILSLLTVTWAAWALWWGIEPIPASWIPVTSSLAVMLAFGLVGGPSTWPILENVLAPILLYSLSLGTIAATLGASKACPPRSMALMAFLATISAGCIALLALYYLDALFSTTYLTGNGDLMWPLSTLLVGTLLISAIVHLSGHEDAIWYRKEVAG